MVEIDTNYLEQQFIDYCRYNTRSDAQSQTIPSTPARSIWQNGWSQT